MYNDNENNNSSNYEGLFARQPDSTSSGVWSNREVYEQPLGPDIVVNRDWYGNAQVEHDGLNW